MKTQTVSYVKSHLAEVIDGVRERAEPVLVTQNGTGAVVIQSQEEYERTRKALLLLKLISLGEREVAAGKTVSNEKLFSDVRARHKLGKRRR